VCVRGELDAVAQPLPQIVKERDAISGLAFLEIGRTSAPCAHPAHAYLTNSLPYYTMHRMADGSNPSGKLTQMARVAQVFTPGAPIDRLALFGGRMTQIIEVINTVGQRGQHVILYGERGVGKTSLVNVLSEIFTDRNLRAISAVKINCNTNDDYSSLWTSIFRELAGPDEPSVDPSEMPSEPEKVRYALEHLAHDWLIVIDELDRLENDEALSLLADTVKTLSDHSVGVTLVLVGVADSIDELIGDHQSVERALTQVQMPRMSVDELKEIVDKGTKQLSLKVEPEAKLRIARLSEGLPHYTHLLSLHAAQQAIADDRITIKSSDVERAVGDAVQKAQHSIKSAYIRATQSPRSDNLFEEALLACALAKKGELGHFTAKSVCEPMTRIMGRPMEIASFARHLNEFAGDARGAVLQKTGKPRGWFYRFANPLLQPFVILSGLAHNKINEQTLRELQERASGSSAPASLSGLSGDF
jgi:Cdc6-like AAA superfamily ATPase